MNLRRLLLEGSVIPAHPLALKSDRTLDERRQVALTRYYLDAGAGGIAVGVHTTQFAIRKHGLLEPVLKLARDEARSWKTRDSQPALIAGVIGERRQALDEAELARSLGYDAGLVSLAGLDMLSNSELVEHCRRVSEVIPLFGFYLQPAVGGRILDYAFWRELAELPGLVAIKVAPFNRYQTLDVVRAVSDAGRADVALYTGNDDAIVSDLVTPVDRESGGHAERRWFNGGLLGQFAVWTRSAVELLDEIKAARRSGGPGFDLLARGAALTDANSAIFDAANSFAGCIPGIHEVLRRQGLLGGTWCLDPHERLSAGQTREIDRVLRAYPFLRDDSFVSENLERWMA